MPEANPQTAPEITSSLLAPAQPSSKPAAPPSDAVACLRMHWPEYAMEGALLGTFMVSACLFGVLYEFPGSPIQQAIASGLLRRLLGGITMGLTAIAIVYSPWGKQSGAHINPAFTLTFFRLGKIKGWDAFFYMASQFLGSAVAVALMALLLKGSISDARVNYAVTIPGQSGVAIALIAEFAISFLLMAAVLYLTNHETLAPSTGLFVGCLVALFITFEAPFSGMSMNPARTVGSAVVANIWTALWIYFVAPVAAMLAAAEVYLWRAGGSAVMCCKYHHHNSKRCIFCGANGGFAHE